MKFKGKFRTVNTQHNTIAITIPKVIVEHLKLKVGQEAYLEVRENGVFVGTDVE